MTADEEPVSAALLGPEARAELLRSVREGYDSWVAAIDDPDLVDQTAADTGWVVRDLEREDQAPVRDLVLGGLAERWGEAFDPSRNPDLDDVWATYAEAGANVVVAEAGGVIVATGTLIAEPDGSGRIVRMSVAASHRRLGLGRAVVAELVARAGHRGLAPVVVLTDTPWISAVALYRSCGFRVVDIDDTDTHLVLGP